MRKTKKATYYTRNLVALVCLVLLIPISAPAQLGSVIVNLATLDGIELNPNNVFNFNIINNEKETRNVKVTGTIRFRQSTLNATYTFDARLYAGNNQFSINTVHNPQWSFSSNALKELFNDYGKLPQGTYEYCVSVQLQKINPENFNDNPVNDCIYQTVNDIFLINLIDPEDDAKIYEYYPMLSWVVNYPFANELTYRVRVVELKKGQNNVSAINRNNPFFQEQTVASTSIVYPVTAKPLQLFQPYIWTVDAYYKGILLGGAEAWKFTIIEDTLLKETPTVQSYFDFKKHIGEIEITALGKLKLKYHLDKPVDTLSIHVFDSKGEEIELPDKKIPLKNGNNLLDIVLHDRVYLKHNKKYNLEISVEGIQYNVPFIYVNPLFIK